MKTAATIIFLVSGAAFLIYEVIALMDNRPGNTWSEWVWAAAARRPLIPFAFGVVAGHFFWQRLCP